MGEPHTLGVTEDRQTAEMLEETAGELGEEEDETLGDAVAGWGEPQVPGKSLGLHSAGRARRRWERRDRLSVGSSLAGGRGETDDALPESRGAFTRGRGGTRSEYVSAEFVWGEMVTVDGLLCEKL